MESHSATRSSNQLVAMTVFSSNDLSWLRPAPMNPPPRKTLAAALQIGGAVPRQPTHAEFSSRNPHHHEPEAVVGVMAVNPAAPRGVRGSLVTLVTPGDSLPARDVFQRRINRHPHKTRTIQGTGAGPGFVRSS
jgi:hypothetical protein